MKWLVEQKRLTRPPLQDGVPGRPWPQQSPHRGQPGGRSTRAPKQRLPSLWSGARRRARGRRDVRTPRWSGWTCAGWGVALQIRQDEGKHGVNACRKNDYAEAAMRWSLRESCAKGRCMTWRLCGAVRWLLDERCVIAGAAGVVRRQVRPCYPWRTKMYHRVQIGRCRTAMFMLILDINTLKTSDEAYLDLLETLFRMPVFFY